MTDVVAVLLCRKGKFLICRRPASKARGLLWEFPGGKIEPGESGPQALERECREELGVTVAVEELVAETVHSYPDISIRLLLYRAFLVQGEPALLEHSAFAWITAEELGQYDFSPADQALLPSVKGAMAAKQADTM